MQRVEKKGVSKLCSTSKAIICVQMNKGVIPGKLDLDIYLDVTYL